MKWIDFKSLERDDVCDDFGMFDFLFYGSRYAYKHWWWVFIPLLNFCIAIGLVIAWITIPFRLIVHLRQLAVLRKSAYDIEDTISDFRLIRSENGYLGLCEWGLSYEFSRRVVIEPKYAKIVRWQEDGYIVTDRNGKMGLYSTQDAKWIFQPCCENIAVESDSVVVVTAQNRTQRYNIKGDRILS